ncbi:MAG: hypothetical protein GXP58_06435 [Deltaproteobacteria bacterium]|nr:hypothetical protein [Deltaproteobacteria bacterium]
MKILLVFVTILVLTSVSVSIVVGIRSFDGTVTDSPYADGIRWDADRMAARSLGWRLMVDGSRFDTGKNRALLSVKDRQGVDHSSAVIMLHLSRPATSRYDRNLPFERNPAGGGIVANLDLPLPGHWIVGATIETPQGKQTLSHEIFARENGEPKQEDGRVEDISCNFFDHLCVGIAGTGGIKVQLDVEPAPPVMMKPLRFTIRLLGNEQLSRVEGVTLSLFMPGMFMGPNRPSLKKVGTGLYVGEGVLPRCIMGKKKWGAKIGIRIGEREESVCFFFEAAS